MENKTYLVEITPIGSYFFGGENTFNSVDKSTNDGQIRNYLVRSRMFPQQTTVLGLLRYVFLVKEGILGGTPEEKKSLIGTTGFMGDEPGASTQWGKISRISSLFLLNGNKKFVVAGQDHQFYTDRNHESPVCLAKSDNDNITFSFSRTANSFYTNLDPKHYASILWKEVSEDHWLSPEDVFVESFQVGITKSFSGNVEDDSYYKQFFYKLKKGFSFGCYLTTSYFNAGEQPGAVIVPFGADQSLFRISFKEEKELLFGEGDIPAGKVKVTLLSDAYCRPEILEEVNLAITNTVDFRFIKTNVHTRRYYNISSKADDMQKSSKINLLERGSVLITDRPQPIIDELKSYQVYRNAGFNQFKIEQLTF